MVLCYHGAREGLEPSISSIPAARLERQIDYFLSRGFNTGLLAEASDSRTLSITLDDGLASQVEAWATPLAERGIRATLFVPAGYVGRAATWDYARQGRRHATWSQLTEWCKLGHLIGSHGMSHCDLRPLNHHDLCREVYDSKSLLEERLGVSVTSLSYPFGRFNERVLAAVQDAGYNSAFTASPVEAPGPWTRPRIVVSLLDTELSLEARMQASLWGSLERGKQRLISFWSGGTALRQTLFSHLEKSTA